MNSSPATDVAKKVIVYGFTKPETVEIIRCLRDEGSIEIVAWFARKSVVPEGTHRLYGFHDYPYTPTNAPDALIDYVLQDLPMFMDMYLRSNRDADGLSVQHRDYYECLNVMHQGVYFAYELITQSGAEAIVFNNLPHLGLDFLIYKVAKFLNVPTILFWQSIFPNKFVPMTDIGLFPTRRLTPEKPLAQRLTLKKKETPFYMKMRKFNYRYAVPELFGSLTKDLLKTLAQGRLTPLLRRSVYVQKYLDYKAFRKNQSALMQGQVDLSVPFVYFPLHLQPELTTSSLGGQYSDQLLALERLRKLIPPEYYIYVKENPGQTEYKRGPGFFRRLKRLPKTRLLSMDTDTFELTDQCRFVATITGTVGWEAVQAGKKALVFGSAWFTGLPGVFQYREDMDIQAFLDTEIDPAALEEVANAIVSRMEDGIVDPVYLSIFPEFDLHENARVVADVIKLALHREIL